MRQDREVKGVSLSQWKKKKGQHQVILDSAFDFYATHNHLVSQSPFICTEFWPKGPRAPTSNWHSYCDGIMMVTEAVVKYFICDYYSYQFVFNSSK